MNTVASSNIRSNAQSSASSSWKSFDGGGIAYSHSNEVVNPNEPPNPESGYIPPKGNPHPSKVPNPNGNGSGWPSKGGGVWVPDNNQHGGAGWTEQFPGGGHRHRYPDGHVRKINMNLNGVKIVLGGTLIFVGGLACIYVVANDITIVGFCDDFLLGPACETNLYWAFVNHGLI